MDQVPLEMKLGIMAKAAGSTRWSISISYMNSRTLGPLDPYIDELYALCETGVTDIGCEITCINHSFFLSIIQNCSSDAFLEVFLGELKNTGIDYEVMGKEALRLCGLEAYSASGL